MPAPIIEIEGVTGACSAAIACPPPKLPSSYRLVVIVELSLNVMVIVAPINSRPDTAPAAPAPATPFMLFGSTSVAKVKVSPESNCVKSMLITSYPPFRGCENGLTHGSAGVTRPTSVAPVFASKHFAVASPPLPTGSKTMSGRIAVLKSMVTLVICKAPVELLVTCKLPAP